MVNELIGLQLITVIWKPEDGERIDRFTADYCDMETWRWWTNWKIYSWSLWYGNLKTGNELIGLKLITVIWKPEGGERIDRFTADYCDMETWRWWTNWQVYSWLLWYGNLKVVNELIDLQLITVIWKPEDGERIDRVKADYCDMETWRWWTNW